MSVIWIINILQEKMFCRIFLSIVITIQLLQASSIGAKQMERCPTMCICDIHEDLNTANCSDEHLISAYIGISAYVELLDLSNNDITVIDNQCFHGLHSLNTLLLDRNSISFIELDAFSSLSQLRSISLSNNRLESFDNRIFEVNALLTNVDLSVNKFIQLPNEPILKSKSLQTLDLHKSFLTHLHVKYFEELPNIRKIDLSGNLLIMLNLAAFAVNDRLQELNIHENRIKCDAQMEMSIIWLRRNNVKVLGDTCPSDKVSHSMTATPKFERIQALSSADNVSAEVNITEPPIDLNSVWKTKNKFSVNVPILNEKCKENESNSNACHLFEMCTSNLTWILMAVDEKLTKPKSDADLKTNYNLLDLHHTWSEFITVQVAFFGGLFLGAMLGAIVLFTMKLFSDCIEMYGMKTSNGPAAVVQRNQHHPYTSEIRRADAESLNDAIQENFNHNQLVSRISQNDENARALVRMNNSTRRQRSSTSIFAIFYERPVRRRYYRQFNRNATNLVRRLSQSRLFLNSSRAQNASNRNNRSHRDNQENIVQAHETPQPNPSEDNVDLDEHDEHEAMLSTHTVHNDCISVHSLNIIHDNRNIETENRLNRRTFVSETDIIRQYERCETPPPPYNTVAK